MHFGQEVNHEKLISVDVTVISLHQGENSWHISVKRFDLFTFDILLLIVISWGDTWTFHVLWFCSSWLFSFLTFKHLRRRECIRRNNRTIKMRIIRKVTKLLIEVLFVHFLLMLFASKKNYVDISCFKCEHLYEPLGLYKIHNTSV